MRDAIYLYFKASHKIIQQIEMHTYVCFFHWTAMLEQIKSNTYIPSQWFTNCKWWEEKPAAIPLNSIIDNSRSKKIRKQIPF